ncbi:hypothetical protein T12_1413 [Trichinella patagoniensis]|uniref:Uncharacterized protein n=1 Tax=Trichinella patagoniensis TaxID=990121 RepID=A0A0V0ZCE9_9BILA|nr:hypothetical protein T12_1413 [Trichinella patagoniensis]
MHLCAQQLSSCVYINIMSVNTGCSYKDRRQRQILIVSCSSLLPEVLVSCSLLIPLCSYFEQSAL